VKTWWNSSFWLGLRAILIAIITLGFTLILTNLSFFSLLELKGLDFLFILRGTLPPPNQIVIVAIDEPSMAEIGRQWPWPRSKHAQLIGQLRRAGAKVIGFDILFAEPSDPAEDQAFARALREAGNAVLVSELAVVDDPILRYITRVDPVPAFEETAAGVGIPTIRIDTDGSVRRTSLLTPDMPSFAIQIVRHYLAKQAQRGAPLQEWKGFSKQDLLKETVLINYLGAPRTVNTVSYYQALDYERMLPPGLFADKIVLVGFSVDTTAEPRHQMADTFLTPFSLVSGVKTSGVEIQATVVDNLLEGRFVSELNGSVWVGLLLAFLLVASLVLTRLNPVAALLTTGVLAGLLFAAAYVVFVKASIWLPIFSGIMGLGLVFGGHLMARTLSAERDRRQAIEEINRSLEAKVAERTQELSQRHQELEAAYQELSRTQEQLIQSEKMASLGLLVAGVAHELNNPISYVHSNLEFVEEYTERLAGIIEAYKGANNPEDQGRRRGDEQKKTAKFEATLTTLKELISSCKEGAERVKKIVMDLRTFSRTDDIGLVPTDLHEGIESTLNLLAKQYKDRITVHRDYGNLPRVECYPGQINQVLMNLLQNAAQAIPDKGDVWIKTISEGGWAIIVIRDNGIGIAEQNLAKIFDPFFTTKPVGMGTGLGLSITYGIIEKHEGRIRVTSKVNEGTAFTVQLPIHLTRKTI